MEHINKIFDNMDKWRHLPAYQLERRADIFFSIYLSELLSYKFGVNVEGVIPEFPIRIGSIHPNVDSNKSFKIDYLAKAKDNKIIFVELKTDEASRRDKQDWYLERARDVGLAAVLEGVRKIYGTTNSREKYRHLLGILEELGLITFDDSEVFRIRQADYDIQIAYLQPNNPGGQDNVITFREAAEIIEKHGDELSLRLSRSLLRWADTKAGDK